MRLYLQTPLTSRKSWDCHEFHENAARPECGKLSGEGDSDVKRMAFLCVVFLLSAAGDAAAGKAAVQKVNLLGSRIAGQIDAIFAPVTRTDCPGCALGVWLRGRVVYARGYGMADLEHPVPITLDTVFEAGSVSKQFTAAAVLLLEKDGKLSLEDDIRKFLPEVPDFGRKITIRHLLTHTSGLRDQWELFTLAGRPSGSAVHTLEDVLNLISRQKELNFPPGEEYLYSNTGFSLLACIVGRASGRSLSEFSQARIFGPLHMTHTQWRDDFTRIVKDRAIAYRMDARKIIHSDMPFTNVFGNGGLLTTVGDLLIWSQNFFQPRIFEDSDVARMQTPARLNNGDPVDYGLGLVIGEYKGIPTITHTGSTAGYRAFLGRFPEQQLSVAILCNLSNVDAGALAQRIVDTLLPGSLKEPPKPEVAAVDLEEMKARVGLYRDMHTDEVLRVALRNGKLVLTGGGPEVELMPVGPGRFLLSKGQVEAVFNSADGRKPATLSLNNRRLRPTVYSAVPFAAPSRRDLEEYRGNYYSEELDAVYSIELRDGGLAMRHWPEPAIALEPAFADAFSDAHGRVVRFTRTDTGRVDGCRISTGRVRHLRFVKRN